MKTKNKFNSGYYFLKASLLKKRTPLNVSFSVTNKCNLHCTYCGIYKRKQNELTKEQIFSLIDELSEMGTQRLGFWGGEPLIRNDIGELINYANKKGIYTTVISNGYLVPQKIDELKNLELLFLSLDGSEKCHDLSKGKGSYKKVIKAIETAINNNIPVWTITVINKNNLNDVDFVINLAKKMGFFATFQVLYRDSEITENNSDILPTKEENKAVINKLIEEKRNGAPIGSSEAYLKHILNWNDYNKTALFNQESKFKMKCFGGKFFCNIDTDGNVYTCDWMIGKVNTLNCVRDGFRKAWDNISIPKCNGCLKSCYSEYNLMFSFNWNAIMNALKLL